jgi:hypothetical protein
MTVVYLRMFFLLAEEDKSIGNKERETVVKEIK